MEVVNNTIYIIINKLKNTTKYEILSILSIRILILMCIICIAIFYNIDLDNIFWPRIVIYLILIFCCAIFFYQKKKTILIEFYYNKKRPHLYYIFIEYITIPFTITFIIFALLISLNIVTNIVSVFELITVDFLSSYAVLTEPSGSRNFWDVIGSPGNLGSGSSSGEGSNPGGGPDPGSGQAVWPPVIPTNQDDIRIRASIVSTLEEQVRQFNSGETGYGNLPTITCDAFRGNARLSPIQWSYMKQYVSQHPESNFFVRTVYTDTPRVREIIAKRTRSGLAGQEAKAYLNFISLFR